MTDLIKRLSASCYLAFEDGTNDYSAAQEAIDRIEQLVKERDDLRNFDDYFRSVCGFKRDGDGSSNMTDQELIAYLKLQGLDKDVAAADRIEELVKERKAMAMRDAGYDVYAALEAKLAKAVGSIKQAIKLWEEEGSGGDRGRKLDNAYDGFELLCNTLAELEGKDHG